MIIFNDLRISPDGKTFFIYAVVPEFIESDSYKISDVVIKDMQDNTIYEKHSLDDKEFSLILDAGELTLQDKTFNDNVFYVEVYTTLDSFTGVAINWFPIYQIGLRYMKEVVLEKCPIPRKFIDYILNVKAMKLAIDTNDKVLLNDLFKSFIETGRIK